MEHAIRVVRMEVVGLLGIVYTVNVHDGIRVLSDVFHLLTSSHNVPTMQKRYTPCLGLSQPRVSAVTCAVVCRKVRSSFT